MKHGRFFERGEFNRAEVYESSVNLFNSDECNWM